MESFTRELIPWIIKSVLFLVAARILYALLKERLFTLLRRYRRSRVARTGVSARARIVDVETIEADQVVDMIDMTGNLSGYGATTHRILLMVQPTSGEPFGADLYLRLTAEQLEKMRPESEVRVMYDPNDTDIVALGGISVTLEESGAPPLA